MKITDSQLEAVGYLFEQANGNELGSVESSIVKSSGLMNCDLEEITKGIIDLLNGHERRLVKVRIAAYWALSKKYDRDLLPLLQKWLQTELAKKETDAVFQLMIALDNLEEPIFGEDRDGGYSSRDVGLNLRDADKYLKTVR